LAMSRWGACSDMIGALLYDLLARIAPYPR
jgi:hypothetical protein